MANALINLITQISGFENFERCVKLCDIIESHELINISENTLNRMEVYLQKKCSKMPFVDRNQFIGENFAHNPEIFKFSPAVRQRILYITENLGKIFDNSTFSYSVDNINEICNNILLQNNTPITKISSHCLRIITNTSGLSLTSHKNVSRQSPSTIKNTPQEQPVKQSNLKTNSTNNHNSKENYPNIFQRMDSLRTAAVSSSDRAKPETDKDKKDLTKASNVVISSVATRSQRLCSKRPIDYCVGESEEPEIKRAKKVSKTKKSLSIDKAEKPVEVPPKDNRVPAESAQPPISAKAIVKPAKPTHKSPEKQPVVAPPKPVRPPTIATEQPPPNPQQVVRKLQLSDCLFQQPSSVAANARNRPPLPMDLKRAPIVVKKSSQSLPALPPPSSTKTSAVVHGNKILIRRAAVPNGGQSVKPAARETDEIVVKSDVSEPTPVDRVAEAVPAKPTIVITPPPRLPACQSPGAVANSEFSFQPQWTSTPHFIANRFINSAKHQNRQSPVQQQPQHVHRPTTHPTDNGAHDPQKQSI